MSLEDEELFVQRRDRCAFKDDLRSRGVELAGKDVRSLGKATLFFVLRYLRVTESAFHSNINDVAV